MGRFVSRGSLYQAWRVNQRPDARNWLGRRPFRSIVIACPQTLRLGTAGWSIASRYGQEFPGEGSHLQRYARRMNCVEIDTSFYRPHRRETYERWAASVRDDFRFSVKLPKTITHERSLAGCEELLDLFLTGVNGLGDKLAVLLVQLPPGLVFDPDAAEPFFRLLRQASTARIACEPRHSSWSEAPVDAMLATLGIARVAAHPAPFEGANSPGGVADFAYFRMHGAPRIYYSDYAPEALQALKRRLDQRTGTEVWCIFDNTAAGHALGDALALDAMWRSAPVRSR